MELEDRAFELLKDLYRSDGACYHRLKTLAAHLDCTEEELYDREEDTGILYELLGEGLVFMEGGYSNPCFMINWEEI